MNKVDYRSLTIRENYTYSAWFKPGVPEPIKHTVVLHTIVTPGGNGCFRFNLACIGNFVRFKCNGKLNVYSHPNVRVMPVILPFD